MSGVQRELPYLNAYLREMQGRRAIPRGFFGGWYPAMLLAAVPLGFLAQSVAQGPPGPFIVLFAGGLMALLGIVNYNLQKPRNGEEKFRTQAFQALTRFQERSGPRRLRRSLHPAAAQVLEACAFHRGRVLGVLDSPNWVRLSDLDHWQKIREDSRKAADLAMLEAILAADPFLGKEQAKTVFDIQGLLGDLAKGDIDDAFEHLGRVFGWEKDDEFANWQSVPEPLHPAYNVAVKLKKLAAELERQAAQAAESPIGSVAAEGSLDAVLHNLEQLRTAEKELIDSDQVRQRLGGQ